MSDSNDCSDTESPPPQISILIQTQLHPRQQQLQRASLAQVTRRTISEQAYHIPIEQHPYITDLGHTRSEQSREYGTKTRESQSQSQLSRMTTGRGKTCSSSFCIATLLHSSLSLRPSLISLIRDPSGSMNSNHFQHLVLYSSCLESTTNSSLRSSHKHIMGIRKHNFGKNSRANDKSRMYSTLIVPILVPTEGQYRR